MNKSLKNKLLALSLTTAITLTGAELCFADDSKNNTVSFGSQIVDASESGNVDGVRSLIAQGANVNELGEFDTTPLMRAAYHGNDQLVILLLNNGANPNMKDLGGATALTIASRENYPAVVKTLVKAGADVNLATSEGTTALSIAKAKNNTEVASILSQADGNSSTEQQTASFDAKPTLALPKAKLTKTTEVANADIDVDMSSGRLANSAKTISEPTHTQVATNIPAQDSVSLASFEPASTIDVPKKPDITASVISSNKPDATPTDQVADSGWIKTILTGDNKNNGYQVSDNQMVGNSGQNSVINLGTYKTPEFANSKISELKSTYGDALDNIQLKVVSKALGPATTYQVIGGLVPNNKANDICSKLVTAGANCRVESSNFASQSEFSQYTGTVAPAPAAAAPVTTTVANADTPTPAPSPSVTSQSLPSITDATKPTIAAAAPTISAQTQQLANTTISSAPKVTTTTTMAAAAPVVAGNVGSFAQNTTQQVAQAAPQVSTSTQVMPLPVAPPPAAPVETISSQTSRSNFDMVNNLINAKNNDSVPPIIRPQTTTVPIQNATLPPVTQVASSSTLNNNSSISAMPLPATTTTTVTQPIVTNQNVPATLTTTRTITAAPVAPNQGSPLTITHVATTNSAPIIAATAPAQQAAPQVQASAPTNVASADIAPAQPTSRPQAQTLPANYIPKPTVIVRSKNANPQQPAQNFVATPALAPLPAPVQNNKFDVARPVKVTDNYAPAPSYYSEPSNNFRPPVTNPYSNRQIWVKIDYFVDESAADYYLNNLKNQDPSLKNYYTRTTRPLTGGKASAEIGPFDSDEAANNVCQTVSRQNQGYRCLPTGELISAHNYAGGSEMRHSSLYNSEPPMGYERHSSAYNY